MMPKVEDIKNTVEQLHGSGKTFAEFLAVLFKDKFIEIYLGDAYEDVSTEQISTAYPAVLCGRVITAYRECLIVEAAYIDAQHKLKMGNMLFISERAIRFLNEIDGNGILEDMMLRSKESLDIKAVFVDPEERHKRHQAILEKSKQL
jgi:hypothetical protein